MSAASHPDRDRRPQPDRARHVRVRRALLRWYDRARRELPWRATREPWPILVSEVMLQQTTVATVIPYWRRFVERWPTPASLAAADETELLAAWAGLGYYRRARMLHATARAATKSGGALPRSAAELRELPGIGAYTAAAVASIAHDERVAVVDGNVERVLSRLDAIDGDPKRMPARARVRALADALLAPTRPGDFNQAVMELGATVCRPRHPACDDCPLEADCAARAQRTPERWPQSAPRPAPIDVRRVAAVVLDRGRVLLAPRTGPPNEGFLDLPALDVDPRHVTPGEGRTLLLDELRGRHGVLVEPLRGLPTHRHGITRHRITVHPFLARPARRPRLRPRVASGAAAPLVWHDPRVPAPPLTTATRAILERLAREDAHASEH